MCTCCAHKAHPKVTYFGYLSHIAWLCSILSTLPFPRRSARASLCTSFRARRELFLAALSFYSDGKLVMSVAKYVRIRGLLIAVIVSVAAAGTLLNANIAQATSHQAPVKPKPSASAKPKRKPAKPTKPKPRSCAKGGIC